jgi:hypothetical protein
VGMEMQLFASFHEQCLTQVTEGLVWLKHDLLIFRELAELSPSSLLISSPILKEKVSTFRGWVPSINTCVMYSGHNGIWLV